MTEQILNPNIPVTPVAPPAPSPAWKNILEKVRPLLTKFSESRFYQNKKIFLPVSIAFGLVFLVLILGLIFGKRTVSQPVTKTPSPSPTTIATPEATTSGGILLDSKNKLKTYKDQIKSIDVKESRLQPPVIDFNIKY